MKNSFNNTTNVLVTQAGTRNGFVITYSLGKRGIPVYCADSQKYTQTRFSRFCRGYATYPSPHSDPDGYLNLINVLIERYKIGLLFPAYDEMIFLAQCRERLINSKVLIAPPYEDIITVHKKTELHKLCNSAGCSSPLTIELKDYSDIKSIISHMPFPFMLKPERGGGGWGVTLVNNEDEFIAKWEAFDTQKHQNKLFAQQYIRGDLYCYGVLCNEGKILASNCFQTLRSHGTSCFRRGVIVEEIENQADKLFSHLKWTGVCQCDYILDEIDGKAYLIDANPRFWGSTAQALASGMNFPFLLYLLGTGQHDGSVVRRTGKDITSSWLWGDFMVMCERLLKEKGKTHILLEHLAAWSSAYFDDLRFDDPAPFFFYPLQKFISAGSNVVSGGF
jgi:predicted ATP-grasp superfamily ATP-dependent carboligase